MLSRAQSGPAWSQSRPSQGTEQVPTDRSNSLRDHRETLILQGLKNFLNFLSPYGFVEVVRIDYRLERAETPRSLPEDDDAAAQYPHQAPAP